MSTIAKLKSIIEEVGIERIWRPIIDSNHNHLVEGIGKKIDGVDPNFKDLDFKNKTICDLGCNMGYFSFLAANLGATHVTGYDIDSRVIGGANKLAKLYNYKNVDFQVCDFTAEPITQKFDMGMMIDILGKSFIASGRMEAFLLSLEERSKNEMLISIRPQYNIEKHLKISIKEFTKLYPDAPVKDGYFDLLKFVQEMYDNKWIQTYISSDIKANFQYKKTIHFKRKSS